MDQTKKEPRILQIMPALPGWEAVWGDIEEPEKGEPGYFTEPVVCWALIEESDGRRYVSPWHQTWKAAS